MNRNEKFTGKIFGRQTNTDMNNLSLEIPKLHTFADRFNLQKIFRFYVEDLIVAMQIRKFAREHNEMGHIRFCSANLATFKNIV